MTPIAPDQIIVSRKWQRTRKPGMMPLVLWPIAPIKQRADKNQLACFSFDLLQTESRHSFHSTSREGRIDA
ncbi:MAG TPA: hypothetical protein DCE55_24045 [Planctomycetaceae bacterium]|nr:hypothetical protein [Planctomycetaceae bacterium]